MTDLEPFSTSLEKRLAEIELNLQAMVHWKNKAGEDLSESPYPDMEFLITSLRKSMEREKILREALEDIGSKEWTLAKTTSSERWLLYCIDLAKKELKKAEEIK